jgi:hypothetical protein
MEFRPRAPHDRFAKDRPVHEGGLRVVVAANSFARPAERRVDWCGGWRDLGRWTEIGRAGVSDRDGERGKRHGARTSRLRGHPRPVLRALPCASRHHMPAARSWSRSSLDAAGECCGRFSPSCGRSSSWRCCLTTVRLATTAARAINPTPNVRISASHSGGFVARHPVRPAPYPANSVPNDRSLPRRRAASLPYGRNPPSLLAIHINNAPADAFLTSRASRVCTGYVTVLRCRLSTRGDVHPTYSRWRDRIEPIPMGQA